MIVTKINIKQCVGCCACVNACPSGCIEMVMDSEGFWYPKVNHSKCTQCNRCLEACPLINTAEVCNEPVAFACINKDEEVRMNSSSGGLFSAIAEQVIDRGGVVFGAGFNSEFEVVHKSVETRGELWELRGSKYIQSRIGETYKQARGILRAGREALFSGTPCQIGGLKSYLGKSYENLLCVDIICHGVPSPAVWRKYIKFREDIAKSSVKKIAFRRKDEGWKRYSVSFIFDNGTEYRENFRDDLFMRAFLKDVCLRPSCYSCRFKSLHRQSDITLADFWGIQHVFPELDDDKGVSLVLVNSPAGLEMFEKIKEKIVFREVDIHEAVKYNTAAIKSARYNPKREAFFKKLSHLSFDQLVRKFCADSHIKIVFRRIKATIRQIVKASLI